MARLINHQDPKSAFMAVEKDTRLIIEKMLKNNRLKRLLYYTSSNALNSPNLTEEQSAELVNNHIRLRPKLKVDPDVQNYVIIGFDNFAPNMTNPQFRDNMISFDIICHLSQWELDNMQIRPYRIAAEIDEMFNNTRLTGIGKVEFLAATQNMLNDEFAGVSLVYAVIHGGEDKNFNQDGHGLISEDDVAQYIKDFNDMYKEEQEDDGWISD